MSSALQDLTFRLSLLDKVSAPLKGVLNTLNTLQTKTLGMGAMKVGIGSAGIAGIGFAIDSLTGKAIEFESKMADVRKVTDFPTPDGLDKFGNEILKLSRSIPISAAGLAEIATAGGQLGIAEKDLLGFTKIVAKMSTAFDMLPDQAGESIAKLSNIFHVPIGDMEKMGDAINFLDNNMAAKSRDIVEVLTRIGGTSQLLGMTTSQATALSAAMLSLGQTPEIAGTSINALLLRLGTARNQSKDFKAALGDIGLSVEQLEANLKSGGAQATINDFLARISKLDKAAQLQTLGQLFGAEYSDNLGILVGGLDQYRNALSLVNEQSKFQGSMQAEFNARSATTENHLKLLSNLWDNLKIKVGTLFLPLLNSAITQMSNFLEPLITGFDVLSKRFPRLAEFLTKFVGLGAVIGVVAFSLLALVGIFSLISAPITLLGAGVAAIGAAIATLGLDGLGQSILDVGGAVFDFFTSFGVVDSVMAKLDQLSDWWDGFDLLMAAQQPFAWLYGGVSEAVSAVLDVFNALGSAASGAVNAALGLLRDGWSGFSAWLSGLDPFGALTALAVSAVSGVIAAWDSVKNWWGGFSIWLSGFDPFGILAALAVSAVSRVNAAWDALKTWWGGFTAWLSGIDPFAVVVSLAAAVVGRVNAALESLKTWWTGFKSWLSGLDPFGALIGGINRIITKVQGIASAMRFSIPTMPSLSLQSAPGNAKGGLGGKLAAAVNNSNSKSVSVTVNNQGGSVSPAAIAHHLKMAGG